MAHVGDVHLQRPVAVAQRLHPHGVVEIARGFAVDGDDIQLAKIAAAGELVRRNRPGNCARLFQNLVGKVMRDVMRTDENLDVDAEIVGQAQDLDDAAHRPVAVFAEIQDFRGDDHAVQIFDGIHGDRRSAHAIDRHLPRGQRHVFGNLDPLADAFVVRNHEIARATDAELADHGEMGAAQHAHDLAVGLSIALDAADLARPRGRRAWRGRRTPWGYRRRRAGQGRATSGITKP